MCVSTVIVLNELRFLQGPQTSRHTTMFHTVVTNMKMMMMMMIIIIIIRAQGVWER